MKTVISEKKNGHAWGIWQLRHWHGGSWRASAMEWWASTKSTNVVSRAQDRGSGWPELSLGMCPGISSWISNGGQGLTDDSTEHTLGRANIDSGWGGAEGSWPIQDPTPVWKSRMEGRHCWSPEDLKKPGCGKLSVSTLSWIYYNQGTSL